MDVRNTRRLFYTIYFLSILSFLIIMTGSFLNMKSSYRESLLLKSALTELNQLQQIRLDIQSVETGQRGYVISGNPEFLKPYYAGLKNIETDKSFLQTRYNMGPYKTVRDSLMSLIDRKLKYSLDMIEARNKYGEDSADALIAKKEGLILMNHIDESLQLLSMSTTSTIKRYTFNQITLEGKRTENYILLLVLLLIISGTALVLANKGFAKQKAREKELLYKTALLSNLYDPVITTDNQYLITSWNENAESLFGYKEAEVLGRRLKDILRSKTENISLDEIRHIILNNGKWNGDIIYLSKNDTTIYANVSTSLVFDENNKSIGTVSIIRDTTDRKTAELELKIISQVQKEIIQSKISELNKVFERTTDAFVSFDKNLNYIYVNEKAARLHHSTVEEMIGKNILDFTPDRSSPEYYQALTESLIHKIEIHNELNYKLTGQWFENWIYPDDDGVSVFYRDVTTRKNNQEKIEKANLKLKALNERFELTLRATNDAIWDWDLVTNEVTGNENYFNLIRNKPPEKSNLEYFSERMNQQDMVEGFKMIQEYLAEKKTNMIATYRYLDPENRWLTIYNRQVMLYDDNGNPFRIVGALQDITQQKESEEQILLEKELSDVLINSLPGVFYMFNKEGKYLRWNKNLLEITGITESDLETDINPLQFVPEEQRAMLAEKISNVFTTGYDNLEADLLTRSGQKIPYYFTGTYIKYKNEDCVMGVGIDISEKVKTQQELQELANHLQNIREEERGIISREIHDELGQQLTGLKMELSLLKKKFLSNDATGEQKMNDAISLVDNTVKTVRRISTELRPGILDDLGLLAAMEWQCEEFQNRYQVETTFDHNLKDSEVSRDKSTAIFRILQESLTNVLRHSKAKKVMVRLVSENRQLILTVHDDGIGFDQNQVRETKSLGLVGMRERAQMIGGTYHISGDSEKGTTIRVDIPF